LGGPLSKLCVTPPFSINFRCQIENQVSDYRLLGASSYGLKFMIGSYGKMVEIVLSKSRLNTNYVQITLWGNTGSFEPLVSLYNSLFQYIVTKKI
jgi:hypothetical protein